MPPLLFAPALVRLLAEDLLQFGIAALSGKFNEIDLTEDGAELDWCGLHIEWTPEGEVWDLDLIDFDDLSYANDFPTDSEVEVRIVTDGEDYAFLINGMITALNPIENYEGYNVIVLEEI